MVSDSKVTGSTLGRSIIKVKGCLWEIHRRNTERHLPYGITQCYLPPDTDEGAPP